ncbi:MAG: tetratricopeptide repeat protein [Acidobacteriota bacterium]
MADLEFPRFNLLSRELVRLRGERSVEDVLAVIEDAASRGLCKPIDEDLLRHLEEGRVEPDLAIAGALAVGIGAKPAAILDTAFLQRLVSEYGPSGITDESQRKPEWQAATDLGDLKRALVIATEGELRAEAESTAASWRLHRALTCNKLGLVATARDLALDCVESPHISDGAKPYHYRALADILAQGGHLDMAAITAKEALDRLPPSTKPALRRDIAISRVRILLFKARCAFRLGEQPDARHVLEAERLTAGELHTANSARALTINTLRAVAFNMMGQEAQAIGLLTSVFESASKAPSPYFMGQAMLNLGIVHSQGERLDDARECLEQAAARFQEQSAHGDLFSALWETYLVEVASGNDEAAADVLMLCKGLYPRTQEMSPAVIEFEQLMREEAGA